jgi:hypothetical protein
MPHLAPVLVVWCGQLTTPEATGQDDGRMSFPYWHPPYLFLHKHHVDTITQRKCYGRQHLQRVVDTTSVITRGEKVLVAGSDASISI